jgi:hypothetical protein
MQVTRNTSLDVVIAMIKNMTSDTFKRNFGSRYERPRRSQGLCQQTHLRGLTNCSTLQDFGEDLMSRFHAQYHYILIISISRITRGLRNLLQKLRSRPRVC